MDTSCCGDLLGDEVRKREGREFVSDEDLNDQALAWLDGVANVRVHGTLGERPAVRFEREQPLLGVLAERPYTGVVPTPAIASGPEDGGSPAKALVRVERRALGEYARLVERVG